MKRNIFRNLKLILFYIILIQAFGMIIKYKYGSKDLTLPVVINSVNEEYKTFYILVAYFNPLGYKSRKRLHMMYEENMSTFGMDKQLIIAELTYGDQAYEVTEPNNPRHIQLKTDDIIFQKENLMNIALKHVPSDCKYIGWIDADIEFDNLNWVKDTIEALKKYKVVQLFEFVQFMGPSSNYTATEIFMSFCAAHVNANTNVDDTSKRLEILRKKFDEKTVVLLPYPHSGLAWACQKEVLDKSGGIYDKHILGTGDYIMAMSLINNVLRATVNFALSAGFRKDLVVYQRRISAAVNGSIGYVPGTIKHQWHGSLKHRNYDGRESILDSGPELFDPSVHVYYDNNGLLKYKSKAMRDYFNVEIKTYLLSRREDD